MKCLLLLSLLMYFESAAQDSIVSRYNSAFDTLSNIIKNPNKYSFRKAVFLTENTYLDGKFHQSDFDNQILILSTLAKGFIKANNLSDYRFSDSSNVKLNFGIYKVLKDSISIVLPNGKLFKTTPFVYDFNDFFGAKEWSNMFVIKLLATHKGNCHSLPYLYKILADELNATCWLSLAPNHTYISNRCRKIGWYNTELTSGEFPIDAWIMASGYIPVEAIQNGIYMDTLSNQQSIALCVLDLAKEYEHKTRNYDDGFILKCCDFSLQYFPKNVQAMLLKAETLKRIYEKQALAKDVAGKATYQEMEALYVKLFSWGYREMPEKMYMNWLQSVIKEREKYSNKLVREVVQGKK
jgi:hypothetical protein